MLQVSYYIYCMCMNSSKKAPSLSQVTLQHGCSHSDLFPHPVLRLHQVEMLER